MPDLQRASFVGYASGRLSKEDEKAWWTASSYRDARRFLRKRQLVPALSILDCVEILRRCGIPPERIEIVPVGLGKVWAGEVVGQYPAPGERVGEKDPVRLFVSHPALEDRFPEGFIGRGRRSPDQGGRESGSTAYSHPLERARREESAAQRLLRVLEAALWQPRMELLRLEGTFQGSIADPALAGVLIRVLGLDPQGIAADRQGWLAGQLWRVGRAGGPKEAVSALLCELLGLPVQVATIPAPPADLHERERTPLGSQTCRLGAGAILGTRLDDPSEAVEIRVGPLEPEKAVRFYRSRQARETLQRWALALLPADRPFRVRILLGDCPRQTRLGAEPAENVLGLTAYLA